MRIERQVVENWIERLISFLDHIDGDPDLEPEPLEEQHDAEADLTWVSGMAPGWYVIAESARRKSRKAG